MKVCSLCKHPDCSGCVGGQMVDVAIAAPAERWAVVELMGHRQRAGRISEVREFGVALLQIETPLPGGGFDVERYGGSSLFSYRVCTEEQARAAASTYAYLRPAALPSAPQLPASRAADTPVDADEIDQPYADEGETDDEPWEPKF